MLIQKYLDSQSQYNVVEAAAGLSPWGMAAIAGGTALGQIGAGLIGANSAAAAQAKELAFRKKLYDQAMKIAVPTTAEGKIDLEMLKSLGSYTPEELEANLFQGDTALSDIQLDPRLKAAQMQALEQIGDVVSSRGLTTEDIANLEQIRRRSAAENMAKQAAIKQDMQQRGQLGAGQELAMRLQGAQSTDNSMQDLEIAKAAQQRSDGAAQLLAKLAGSIRGQDYEQAAAEKAAIDLNRRYNTQYAQNVQQQNWATKNQANLYNLEKAQNIANQNVATANQQEQYNKALRQQQFNNQVAKQGVAAGAGAGVANALQQQAATQAGLWGGIGQALGGAGSGLMNYFGKQQDAANALALEQQKGLNAWSNSLAPQQPIDYSQLNSNLFKG